MAVMKRKGSGNRKTRSPFVFYVKPDLEKTLKVGNDTTSTVEINVMRVYENLVEAELSRNIDSLAEAALEMYGLAGAQLEMVSTGDDTLFQVSIPSGTGSVFHPYLGRIEGKRFLLQMREAGTQGEVSMYSEVAWLAEMLRETDLNCPEPVPACDGSLVAEVAHEGADHERRQCVLFRWPDGEISFQPGMLSVQRLHARN